MIYIRIKRHLSIIPLLILVVSVAWGQQNPFEIISRTSDSSIQNTKNSLPDAIDSSNKNAPFVGKASKKIASILSEQREALRVDSLNPFEVDHIPLKKLKAYKNDLKAERLEKGHHAENRFIFWYLLLSCGILAIILNTRIKLISLSYSSMFNQNMMKLFLRDEGSKSTPYMAMLYSVFLINATTVFYYIGLKTGVQQGHNTWLLILASLFILLIIRHLGLYIIGNLFLVSKDTSLYSFSIMVFYILLGIVLISFNIIVAFGPESWHNFLLNITLIVFILFVLVRTIMGLQIISPYLGNRIFQSFLYLCTIEIAPVLILIKSFLKYSENFG